MKLWRRASALLKDKNSIYLAKLARKTAYRNPEMETAIIKATSHDESRIDYKNAQRVFTWVRTSPSFIKPLIWSISTRMEKTRSWVVALKGLLLMHGIFCCKIPSVRKIGRLPFDLSNFYDGHSNSSRTFGLSAFVRAYFAFLDQKSAYDAMLFDEDQCNKRKDESSTVQVLVELQRLQALLDLLIQVKPYLDGIYIGLVIEAMDCILIEIFDVYSRICNGIAGVLVGIFEANQLEAKMALKVLQKAGSQGEELSAYFEFCKDIGVLNASEFPRVDQIPEEDIRDLEKIINGVSEKQKPVTTLSTLIEKSENEEQNDTSKAIVVTDNWVTFDDEFKGGEKETSCSNLEKALIVNPFVEKAPIVDPFVEKAPTVDPFAASVNCPPPLICDRPWHSRGYGYSNGCMQLDQYYCSPTNQMGGDNNNNNNNNNNNYNNYNNNNVNQRNLILSL